jgi:hypothetical protein
MSVPKFRNPRNISSRSIQAVDLSSFDKQVHGSASACRNPSTSGSSQKFKAIATSAITQSHKVGEGHMKNIEIVAPPKQRQTHREGNDEPLHDMKRKKFRMMHLSL